MASNSIFLLGEEQSETNQSEPNDSLLTINPDMMEWGEESFLEMSERDRAAIESVLFKQIGLEGETFLSSKPYKEYPLSADVSVRVYSTNKGDNKYLHGIFYDDGQRMWMVGHKDMSVAFPDF